MAEEKPLSLGDEPTTIAELLTEQERRDLEAKHGDITAVKTDCGVAVFRVFKRAEYGRYNKLLFDEKTRAQATEALVAACVVKPEPAAFQQWIDRRPGIVTTCANAVLELGGVRLDAETKKYSTA